MPHPKTAEDLCENCIHWRLTKDSATPGDSEGECRRFPPMPLPVNQGDGAWRWAFPTVREGHWCGEFEDIRETAPEASDRLRKTAASSRAENARLKQQAMQAEQAAAAMRQALTESVSVIEGLADQQAMPDDFYRGPLERIKRAASHPEGRSDG